MCVQEPCVYLLHAASTVIRNTSHSHFHVPDHFPFPFQALHLFPFPFTIPFSTTLSIATSLPPSTYLFPFFLHLPFQLRILAHFHLQYHSTSFHFHISSCFHFSFNFPNLLPTSASFPFAPAPSSRIIITQITPHHMVCFNLQKKGLGLAFILLSFQELCISQSGK